jgi:DNA polymerase-1
MAARLYNENISIALKNRAVSDLGIHWAKHWEQQLEAEVNRLAKSRRMPKKKYLKYYGYAETPINLCGFYACYDIDFTGQLKTLYERFGVSSRYERIWRTEMQLLEALCDMEEYGCLIDVEYLEDLRARLTAHTQKLWDELEHMLQWSMFNIGSDKELRKFLYEGLRIDVTRRTKGQLPSVEGEVLESVSHVHPAIPVIQEWREAEKIRTTWTDSILDKLDSSNILHGSLQSDGTRTGRLASNAPNLQNFSSDSDDRAVRFTGRKIEDGGTDPWSVRRAFIVRKNESGQPMPRLVYDFSQIELRCICHYTCDPIMMETYLSGGDIHDRTQREIGSLIDGTPIPRRPAKVINFGLAFGLSSGGLARNAKIPLDQAELFMDKFFERYNGVKTYRDVFWNKVRLQGNEFVNLFGRPRRLPRLSSPTRWERGRAERQAFGSLIQGTAAELTKESIVRIHQWLKATGHPANLVSTVHDEVWVDCDPSCLTDVAVNMKRLMENYPEFHPIPIIVDGQYTITNWAEKLPLPL